MGVSASRRARLLGNHPVDALRCSVNFASNRSELIGGTSIIILILDSCNPKQSPVLLSSINRTSKNHAWMRTFLGGTLLDIQYECSNDHLSNPAPWHCSFYDNVLSLLVPCYLDISTDNLKQNFTNQSTRKWISILSVSEVDLCWLDHVKPSWHIKNRKRGWYNSTKILYHSSASNRFSNKC